MVTMKMIIEVLRLLKQVSWLKVRLLRKKIGPWWGFIIILISLLYDKACQHYCLNCPYYKDLMAYGHKVIALLGSLGS
jgi:hypothetical protein